MRQNRFLGDFDFSHSVIRSADHNLIAQMRNVLRLKSGESVVLTDGFGKEVDAVIDELSVKSVVFKNSSAVRSIDAGQRCILYCALIKHDRFEYVVQKAAEIGIGEIVPLITSRTVKQNVRRERLQAIAREAVEQSCQAWMPAISEPMDIAAALQKSRQRTDVSVFCDIGGENIFSILTTDSGKSVSLFIGPEGGWDDEERDAARVAGCRFASLGNSILRADTAAVAAAFLARNFSTV